MADSLVIIPTYNENENIEDIVRYVFSMSDLFDILVVDDNSPDGTSQIVQELQKEFPQKLHLLNRKNKEGLGKAYLAGFDWALSHDYSYIFEMDADFSHPPKSLLTMREALVKDQADLVIGSRYLKGKIGVANWDLKRILLSYFASLYVRLITQIPVRDTTAGFVGYKREVLEKLDLKKIEFIGYAFQIEMKYKAWKKAFRIKEIPIVFVDRQKGKSKMHGSIISEAALGVLKMKWKSINHKL